MHAIGALERASRRRKVLRVNRHLALLALLACAPRPAVVAPASTAQATPRGVEAGDLNRTLDPCADFDAFANGNWRAANPIPPGAPRWSRRVAARETNRRQLQGLLEALASRPDWPEGSVEQLLGAHYTSCMDEARADAAGVMPLAPLLAELDGARSQADLQRVFRRLHELGLAAPFGVLGGMDVHEPLRFIANVVAGGIGLPDREAYSKPLALATYRLKVARVLSLGGLRPADADRVVALEQRLAEASLDAATAADPLKTDHLMTFAQLEQLAPHVEWKAYFREAGLPEGELNVAEPKFLQRLDAELVATPLATWKAYLGWRLLDAASPWLSAPFVEASGVGATPRARRCVESTEALFGDALAQKYVEQYFPPAAKAKASELAQALLAELKEALRQVTWMTPPTKQQALEKLASYDLQLGYPVQWKRYAGVWLHRDTLWANVAAGRRFTVEEDRRRIGKPTSRDVWQLPATSPDAYIDLQLNQIVLPAGFLQPPAFSLEASAAVNFGALGVGMAHDLTHAIDLLGAQNDARGRPQNWWTDADREGFARLGRCVVEQFDGYFIEPGVHQQGQQVLGEAVGDLAGVRLAWLALQHSMQRQPVPAIDALTPAQQFFVAWAQFRGADERLEAQRQALKADTHPVAKFRVLGPLSNSEAFAEAFGCKAGSAMVRPAEARCAVW